MRRRRDDFEVDHSRYLTERRHRHEVHSMYRRVGRQRGIREVRILHEADDACCRRQPWPETAAAITAALARDGEAVAWLLPDRLIVGNPVVAPAVHTLMPWSPELARCPACWHEHDRLHMPPEEDQRCDVCGHVSEEQLGFVTGPWFGILYVIAACPDCFSKIRLEVAAV